MSTVSTPVGAPLRSRAFLALLIGSAAVFVNFALLAPVVPLWVVHGGAGDVAAGASTGVFMAATVLAQLAMTRLVPLFGYRVLSIAGALFLGLPVPLFLVLTAWQPIVALSFVRGVGFGLITVCGSALVAELVPSSFHGKGSAWYGIAVGVPLLVGLPVATWLATHVGFGVVFVAATVSALLGAGPLALLRRVNTAVTSANAVGSVRDIWRPWLPMFAGSLAFGALTTFVPLMFAASPAAASAALLVMSATALGGRWWVGVRTVSAGRWLALGLVMVGVGLLGVAIGAPWLAVAAAAVYGAGFGAVQNESLVIMFGRVPAAWASVVWNVAFDAGQGLGAVAVGTIAAASNYTVAFGVLGAFALVLLPVTWWRRQAG